MKFFLNIVASIFLFASGISVMLIVNTHQPFYLYYFLGFVLLTLAMVGVIETLYPTIFED